MYRELFFLALLSLVVSCSGELSEKEKQLYMQKGNEISKATFKELSSNLMEQMKNGGPSQAIPFCNTQAIPITESISKTYNVEIKRTSKRLRSCDNEPSKREIEIINGYQQLLDKKEVLQPIVERDENKKIQYYAPIIMQANCLACHGKINETMTAKTDSIIKSYYQFDIATAYKEGDLRGIWSISFKD